MLLAPDNGRIAQELDRVFGRNKTNTTAYHEESIKPQKKFIADVKSLPNVVKGKGNHHINNKENLNRNNTPYVMDQEVIVSPRNMKPRGKLLHAAQHMLRTE